MNFKLYHDSISIHSIQVSFYYILFKSALYCLLFFRHKFFFLTFNFFNQKCLLKPVSYGYGPNFRYWHFQHIYTRSTKARLIQKRRNLLTLLNGDAFYPLSTWPQDIQQLERNPMEIPTRLSWCCFSWVMAVHCTWRALNQPNVGSHRSKCWQSFSKQIDIVVTFSTLKGSSSAFQGASPYLIQRINRFQKFARPVLGHHKKGHKKNCDHESLLIVIWKRSDTLLISGQFWRQVFVVSKLVQTSSQLRKLAALGLVRAFLFWSQFYKSLIFNVLNASWLPKINNLYIARRGKFVVLLTDASVTRSICVLLN